MHQWAHTEITSICVCRKNHPKPPTDTNTSATDTDTLPSNATQCWPFDCHDQLFTAANMQQHATTVRKLHDQAKTGKIVK